MYAAQGTWSAYTLLIASLTVLVSIVLLVSVMVLAFLGRFTASTGEEETPSLPGAAAGESAETPDAPATGAPAGKPSPQMPRRQPTGLWQALCAAGASIPAALVWNYMENIYGQMVPVTIGTALCALLFAGQLFLAAWFIRIQRRRPF